jgi:hypothetical protein
LIRKNILTKDGRNPASGKKINAPATIARLYKFYITDNNPPSVPVFRAYAQQKKAYERLEERPQTITFSSPSGKKTGASYLKQYDRNTISRVKRSLPDNVSPRFGKYYKTVKHVRDEFTFRIRPPIKVNQATQGRAEHRAETVSQQIADIINAMYTTRKALYSHHAMGAIIAYHTSNIETMTGVSNPDGYIRVPWTRFPKIDFFRHNMVMGFDTAIGIVFNYPGGTVTIYKVEVYISTIFRGTNIDHLRIRS